MKTMQIRVLLFTAWLLAMGTVPAQAKEARPAGVSLYGETLLAQINIYRQENGLNGLRFDPGLIQLAKNHSFAMFQQKRIGHSNFNQRFERADSRLCVENVGWNFTNPLKMFDSWRASRGHDENMLKEGITRAGIAEVGDYVTFFACK